MPTHALLALVADAVVPLLAGMALARGVWIARRLDGGASRRMFQLTIIVLAIAYAFKSLDLWMSLWPRFGLDYSTHTAVTLALTSVMWSFWASGRWAWVSVSIGYCALMRWLGYHTWSDMLTTAAALSPWFALAVRWAIGARVKTTAV